MEAEEHIDDRKGDCRTAEPMMSLRNGPSAGSAAERTDAMRVTAQHADVWLAVFSSSAAFDSPPGRLTWFQAKRSACSCTCTVRSGGRTLYGSPARYAERLLS